MKSLNLLFGAILVGIAVVGCESKFVESSPDSVRIEGLSLGERMDQKTKVDARIDEIQKGADKAKRIVDMFKRIQSPSYNEDVYTPIDFLIDANKELKAKIPENGGDGRLVRRGSITLPIKNLTESCKTIQTVLESSVIYDPYLLEKTAIGERLTYSLKTCGSGGEYLAAIEADWIRDTLEFRLVNENLEAIFSNILQAQIMKDSRCSIKNGDKKIIESIRCENLDVRLSTSERATINSVVFTNSGHVRFESSADIFENGQKKAISAIKVYSDGQVDADVKKIQAVVPAKAE